MLRKEREVVYLIEEYLDNIKEWQKLTLDAVLAYFMDDPDGLKLAILKKNHFQETKEAGRQQIWKLLCAGAYFPAIRGSLFAIITDTSRISEAATECCEIFFYEHPQVPQRISTRFTATTQATFNLFKPVYDSILQYLKGIDVVRTISRNTEVFWKLKKELNLLQDDLKHQLSITPLKTVEKTKLNMCAQSIYTLSRRIIAMEDSIQMITAKLAS